MAFNITARQQHAPDAASTESAQIKSRLQPYRETKLDDVSYHGLTDPWLGEATCLRSFLGQRRLPT